MAERRPLRADAQRNRARLLEVAERVFAAKGTSASTEEIAREAGVGVGTVFRHFPTKEALLEAVFVCRLRRLADEADALTSSTDPGTAFFTFFTGVVEQSATKNALAEAGIDVQRVSSEVRAHVVRALGSLLAGAQEAGAVRDDIGVPELLALLIGASRTAEYASEDRAVQARALAIVLDGLRR
ncbi:TetR/AcrR family transcriptional regulator [Solihabitans fulvus]|uniref:TetR/AcrR family transcriptional regulator n=1 Tax=Solihabitans fulvus TaxID=1892852 RepID=A0A5B2X130_9PSEU|nr:TetR/AcrR family transcriptional regulator [Solihabitans fulvus]KAA2256736.1 TetR/AcrR family transcriptional regulator [Solihabitans fulvus]